MKRKKIAGFDYAQVLAPLVIGITGHRDICQEDRKPLEEKVKGVFLKLRKDYGETPLILISPLAEGADRLAAEAALAANVAVRLVVPLPMPIELYEKDFEHVAALETPLATVIVKRNSREEFRALLKKAYITFELDLAEENSREAIAKQGPARDLQYEMVGKYIAQQSQILIALWDGVDVRRVGGTAAVVQFQTEGVPGREVCELEAPEGFPVYHILTPREKNPYPQGKVLELHTIYPKVFRGNDVQAETYYRKMFGRLNEFNRYITHAGRGLGKEIAKSKSYLLQETPEEELFAEMKPALNRYAGADALAIHFQKRWFAGQVGLHVLTFIAFCLFLLFADLHEHALSFLRASACAVFLLYILKKTLSGKLALDSKHEDYRAMAEGLRVKFFWRLAGIQDAIADHYLGKQRSELDWIRNGFRGWNVAEGRQNREKTKPLDAEEHRARLGFVRKYWIDDQQRYFRRAAERNLRSNERFEHLGLFCMAGVLLLGAVLAVRAWRGDAYLEPMAICLEVLLAAAAILHHFNNRMAFAEHAKQYERMATLFAHGSELLGKFLEDQDYQNAEQCVRNVGKEALTENGDWVLLHRERPLEVPHP